jgi:hypothetical protein
VSDQPNRAFFGDNEMKLGTFCLNISGGMMMSTAAKNTLDWGENVAVAQAADSAGWEFLLPLGRWRGQGGTNNSNAEQYETFTWASAIAAVTKRIQVFTTCHVPIFHPMMAAKMGATIDHISNGRFGMNIVAGWNELEFGMFGIEHPTMTVMLLPLSGSRSSNAYGPRTTSLTTRGATTPSSADTYSPSRFSRPARSWCPREPRRQGWISR